MTLHGHDAFWLLAAQWINNWLTLACGGRCVARGANEAGTGGDDWNRANTSATYTRHGPVFIMFQTKTNRLIFDHDSANVDLTNY